MFSRIVGVDVLALFFLIRHVDLADCLVIVLEQSLDAVYLKSTFLLMTISEATLEYHSLLSHPKRKLIAK
jgi:hypothetical protein